MPKYKRTFPRRAVVRAPRVDSRGYNRSGLSIFARGTQGVTPASEPMEIFFIHPFIIAELALGSLRDRKKTLEPS